MVPHPRNLAVLLSLGLGLTACGDVTVQRSEALPACSEVRIQGAVALSLPQDNKQPEDYTGLLLRGSSAALAAIELITSETGQIELTVPAGGVQVELYCPGMTSLELLGEVGAELSKLPWTLSKLALYGNSELAIAVVNADAFDLRAAGNARVVVDELLGEALQVLANGSSQVALGGESPHVSVHAAAQAQVDLAALTAQHVTVNAVGHSRVAVRAGAHLTGSVADEALVSYRGNPDVSLRAEGQGKLQHE